MDLPRIGFGICSYGNLKGLNDTLLSIAPLADQILIVNVPFLGFPAPTSGPPLHIYEKGQILQCPNTILFQQTEPISQINARNKYLELTNTDFLLVLDDDEIVYSYSRQRLQSSLETAKEKMGNNPFLFTVNYLQQNGILNVLPRLFYLPNRFRHADSHYHFLIDGKYWGAHSSKNIDGITLKHKKPEEVGRTMEFEKSMEKYEIWQRFNEKQY